MFYHEQPHLYPALRLKIALGILDFIEKSETRMRLAALIPIPTGKTLMPYRDVRFGHEADQQLVNQQIQAIDGIPVDPEDNGRKIGVVILREWQGPDFSQEDGHFWEMHSRANPSERGQISIALSGFADIRRDLPGLLGLLDD